MPRKKPQRTPGKPGGASVVFTEYDDETDRYRGMVRHPSTVSGDGKVQYEGTSWFASEEEALQTAEAWCRDRGIACVRE